MASTGEKKLASNAKLRPIRLRLRLDGSLPARKRAARARRLHLPPTKRKVISSSNRTAKMTTAFYIVRLVIVWASKRSRVSTRYTQSVCIKRLLSSALIPHTPTLKVHRLYTQSHRSVPLPHMNDEHHVSAENLWSNYNNILKSFLASPNCVFPSLSNFFKFGLTLTHSSSRSPSPLTPLSPLSQS